MNEFDDVSLALGIGIGLLGAMFTWFLTSVAEPKLKAWWKRRKMFPASCFLCGDPITKKDKTAQKSLIPRLGMSALIHKRCVGKPIPSNHATGWNVMSGVDVTWATGSKAFTDDEARELFSAAEKRAHG